MIANKEAHEEIDTSTGSVGEKNVLGKGRNAVSGVDEFGNLISDQLYTLRVTVRTGAVGKMVEVFLGSFNDIFGEDVGIE